VIKLKDPRSKIYSAFHVCEIDPCEEESTRIWASNEIRIIDVCESHYQYIQNNGDLT
jgi:hypothetical protein